MPFYEVIFEPGYHSVMEADSDEDVLAFATEQHSRAKSGLPSGPAGDRADRVARIFRYDEHPGDDAHVTNLDEKQTTARLKEVMEQVDMSAPNSLQVVAENLVPPVVLDTPVHESNYAYKESGELNPEDWGGEAR
jgi:hypothetical protein